MRHFYIRYICQFLIGQFETRGHVKNKSMLSYFVILRLHYVPGGHGGHVSDNRDQNGITVRRRRGTGLANVARRDNRGHRDKFLTV